MPSVKNIEKVKELSSSFQKAKAIYFTEYQGLNVEQINRLRSMFFKENIDSRVAKNTLMKIVLIFNKYILLSLEICGFTLSKGSLEHLFTRLVEVLHEFHLG